MAATTTRNFHVPLAEPLYESLKSMAKRTKRPATALAREAIERWVREEERKARHRDIAAFAAAHGGTDTDLDEELERAGIEHLAGEDAGEAK